MKDDLLTKKIIACAYKVHNELGAGFLEKVYQNALAIELDNAGFDFEMQHPIKVYYRNTIVGEYFADIIVNNTVILELKAVRCLEKIHEVQLVNYLQATKTEIGLLINFGESVNVKRKFRQYNKPHEAETLKS